MSWLFPLRPLIHANLVGTLQYSLKRTWPQPADLLYKKTELAALEVEEFNLTRIFINDQKQLTAQYERELAGIRFRQQQLKLKEGEEQQEEN